MKQFFCGDQILAKRVDLYEPELDRTAGAWLSVDQVLVSVAARPIPQHHIYRLPFSKLCRATSSTQAIPKSATGLASLALSNILA